MIDGGEYIENSSKIDNGAQLSVEWPDPRAAITLNKPISSMGGELEDAEIHAPISGGQSPIQSQPLIQDTPLRASAPAKPETTKSEVGSLVSRTFPFFRSSSQSSSPALAKGGNVAQNGTSVNSVAVNGAVGVNSAPHGAAHQNGSVVLDAQKGGTAVNAGGIMSGNAMLSGGPLAGNQAAQNGEAGANVLGRNPAWKEQRPGSPGDVISAIKGRTQLPPEEEIKARFGTNIKSALGPGTIIEGKFRFDSPVSIEGTLIGEVTSNSVLIVGSQATVTAKISVGSLIILGRVHGDVECEELLEIKSTGHLEGDVRSKRIAIDDGGWFRGLCTPTSKPEPSEI